MHTGTVALNQHPVHDDPLHSNTTPFALMFPGRTPPPLRVFGSVAYSLVLPKAARKDNLKYPGKLGWFIGYSDYSDDFMVYDPLTRTVSGRRDVLFDENWRYSPSRPPDKNMSRSFDGAERQPQADTSFNSSPFLHQRATPTLNNAKWYAPVPNGPRDIKTTFTFIAGRSSAPNTRKPKSNLSVRLQEMS